MTVYHVSKLCENIHYQTEKGLIIPDICIVILVCSVIYLHRARLGVDSVHVTPATHNPPTFEAEVLVEEVLCFTNKNIAAHLLRTQALTTPLLVQSVPSQTDMTRWRSTFAKFARSSVGLARHFLPPGKSCFLPFYSSIFLFFIYIVFNFLLFLGKK